MMVCHMPLVDNRPSCVFRVKFSNLAIEGDGNFVNAGVLGSNPLSSTRKSAQMSVITERRKQPDISVACAR